MTVRYVVNWIETFPKRIPNVEPCSHGIPTPRIIPPSSTIAYSLHVLTLLTTSQHHASSQAAHNRRRRLDRHRQIRRTSTLQHLHATAPHAHDADHASQLAVSLAQRYNGEVINGDAMQLYSGLPIITNKITVEERKGIPHHLLGCIGLDEPTWVVGTFVKRALSVIEEIRSRGKLPILVGGTHYYTQSLLFRDRLAEAEENVEETDRHEAQGPTEDLEDKYPILKESTEKLLETLQDVDPVMAERWHPNDRRKIQRSLEIYLQTGRKASDIYAEQRLAQSTANSADSSSSEDSGLRFPTLLFWIHAETETLRTRLDSRVDKMLQRGLLDEVRTLHDYATEHSAQQPIDDSRGIWVSIGYKEFSAYTAAVASGTANETDLRVLKDEAVERTKIATRQYAKRQTRWIRIKLLQALQAAQATSSLYLLDGTSIADFATNVLAPAADVTQAFLSGEPMPEPKDMSEAAAEVLTAAVIQDPESAASTPKKWLRQKCELCGVTCVTEKQWEAHARSRAHRRLVSKKRKLEEEEERGGGGDDDDAASRGKEVKKATDSPAET
jgi:tRNA dimethylallyltransferase